MPETHVPTPAARVRTLRGTRRPRVLQRSALALAATLSLPLSGCAQVSGFGPSASGGHQGPSANTTSKLTPLTTEPTLEPTRAPTTARTSPYQLVLPGQRTKTPPGPNLTTKPNIVMVTTDDESILDMKYMPHVRKLIADTGVTFTDSLAPSPMCVPARASLLSGQYAHNHGAYTISGAHGGFDSFNDQDTLPVWMKSAGYDTFFAGKYLNGYGDQDDSKLYVPPGWDTWLGTVGASTYNFMNPIVNDNGKKLVAHHVYNTRLFSAQSQQYIASRANSTKPFFMWVNYVAPHHGGPRAANDPIRLYRGTGAAIVSTVPDPRDNGIYANVALPDRPDMFPTNTKDLPKHSPAQRRFTPLEKTAIRAVYDQRIEAVRGVDRAVAATVATLKRAHKWKNTIFVFTSDNGYATGEHNVLGKLWHYNEILRVPILMTGPGIPRDKRVATAITNPDIPVTLAAAAGAHPTRNVDGVNMLPWLNAPTQLRAVPIESWRVTNGAKPRLLSGIRVGPWTFAHVGGGVEMYNRATDPYEMHNLARKPAYRAVRAELSKMTARYLTCAGDTCPKDFYPANPSHATATGTAVPGTLAR